MMNFKTPLTKLVRHLFQSREKWKERAKKAEKELSLAKKNSTKTLKIQQQDDNGQKSLAVIDLE
jgi:hypothetical protein